MNVHVLTFLLLTIFIKPLFSQQNRVDSLSKYDNIWTGSVSLNGLFQSGNTNKITILGKGEFKRVDGILETDFSTSYFYGIKNGVKDNNTLTSVIRADFLYDQIISYYFLQSIEYDYSKGIDLRFQTGAGVKWIFMPKSKNKTSASLALIVDNTDLVKDPRNYNDRSLRFSFRLKTNQELFEKHLNINAVGYYQPDVENFANNNQRLELTLSVPVVSGFSVNSYYLYTFDNTVSVGRKRADNLLTFGLKYAF